MDAKEQAKKIVWALNEAVGIAQWPTIISNGLESYHQLKSKEEAEERYRAGLKVARFYYEMDAFPELDGALRIASGKEEG